MENEKMGKVQQFMLEEYQRFAPIFNKYQWPWETARWHELVFCLLVSIDDSEKGIATARETTQIFAELDLLDVETLARSVSTKRVTDTQEFSLMREILQRQGYSEAEAETAAITICEAAHALQQGFDGKVQKYLRKYGELMLSEASRHFSFSRISDAKVKYALSNWLQNVLNMPVPFSNPNVEALCEKFGIGTQELIDVADRDAINVALIDDWAADYSRRQKLEASHG